MTKPTNQLQSGPPEDSDSGLSRLVRSCDVAGSEFVLWSGFDPGFVAAVKQSFNRRRLEPADKTWRVPLGERDAMRAFVDRHGVRLSALASAALDDPSPVDAPNGMVSVKNGELLVKFDYDRRLVAELNGALDVKRFDKSERGWLVPFFLVRPVRAFAERHGFATTPEVDALPDVDPAEVPVSVLLDGGELVVRLVKVSSLKDKVSLLPGARWVPNEAVWRVPVEHVGRLVSAFESHAIDIGEPAKELIAQAERLQERVQASWTVDAQIDLPEGFGYQLLPFQRGGVAYALEARRSDGRHGCLIGDDPGLGKSVEALAVIAMLDLFPVVIVCPKKPKRGWMKMARRALLGWRSDLRIVPISGTNAPPTFGLILPDIVVVHYDVLGDWLPAILSLRPLVVVFDEVHRAKSPGANRTQLCIELAKAVPVEGGVFGLSGTLVPNRRRELVEPLRIVGWLDELGGEANVLRRPDLADSMRSRCLVRRTKNLVLPDLPPRDYQPLELPGDPTVMAHYNRAEREFLEWLQEWATEKARSVGEKDPLSYASERVIRAAAAQALVRLNHLRRLVGKAKVPAAVEWCRMFHVERPGDKLLVFAEHVREPPVLREVAKALNAPRIDGDTSERHAEEIEDRFQNDPEPWALCLSRAAAGEGLTLTAAHEALFVELPWGPGPLDQALDRFHSRVNDPHAGTGWQLVVKRPPEEGGRTVDARMLELITEKREESHESLDAAYADDEQADIEDGGGHKTQKSVLSDLVWQMTKEAV